MDDLKITNEMVKEHLMGLSMDRDFVQAFEKIDTKTKTAFTKQYNKSHQEITKTSGGKKLNKAQLSQEDLSQDSSSEDDQEGVLLDENEINEIKAAKAEQKAQKKALLAMKRVEKLSIVQQNNKAEES